MRLAVKKAFAARWTEEIHAEWIRNLLADRPDLSPERLQRTRALMDKYSDDCLVTGYEGLIEELKLPDPNDRHVLAAAIKAKASVIITANLKDFPGETLRKFGITAQHPDDFIAALFDLSPDAVIDAMRRHRAALKKPPKTPQQYVETLSSIGLTKTASRLTQEKMLENCDMP